MIGLLLVVLAQSPGSGLGGTYSNPLMVKDEGVLQQPTRATVVNCSGAGVTCTQSGQTWTLTVPGGGGGGPGGDSYDGGKIWSAYTADAAVYADTAGFAHLSGSADAAGFASVAAFAHTSGSADASVYAATAGVASLAYSADAAGFSNVAAWAHLAGSADAAGFASTAGAAQTAYAADASITAAQLAADPVACGAGGYVTDISASGALTCSTPPGTYTLPDSTNLVTGGVRLTGDLAGTATSPSVVDDSHAHTTTTISGLDTGDISSGTLSQGRGGTGAGALTCSAGDFLTSNGTAYSCSTPTAGAPTSATYITQTANGTLTNEQALSSLSTGLMKVTTGTGVLSTAVASTDYAPATSGSALLLGNGSGGFSSYAGASCTNQFPRSLSTAGAATCASVALGTDTSGTLPISQGGTNGSATPTAGGIAYGTGTAYAVTSAGTGGDCLKSGGSGAPTWGSCSSISAYGTIEDEATPLTQRTSLNFAGAGVTCADDTTQTTCTIPGSSGPTVQTARTTGTHTVGATTATEVTALQVSLAGAATYDVQYRLRARSSATGNGYKYGVNVTSNLSSLVCVAMHPTTGGAAATGIGDGVQATLTGGIMEVLGAANAASTTGANMGPSTGVAATTETVPVLINCSIVTSGAGDLELWMGSEAAVNVTTEANSYVIVTTIP